MATGVSGYLPSYYHYNAYYENKYGGMYIQPHYVEEYYAEGNYSIIKIDHINLKSSMYSQSVKWDVSYDININGTTYNCNGSMYTSNYNYTSWPTSIVSNPIYHNSDGSKAITISLTGAYTASGQVGAVWGATYGTLSTAAVTLTTIPLASTIVATDANIGSVSQLTVTRKSTNYTHTIKYTFGSLSGYVDSSGNAVGSAVKMDTLSIGFTVPTTFYSQITNGKTGVCTLTITTYSGNTQIGDAKTCTFTVTAAESLCKPDVSGTVVDTNSATIALTGSTDTLVRYMSNALCTISAEAKNDSTIEKQYISGVEVEISSGGDTLTWDGNTEGLEVDSGGMFYKVSNVVLSEDEIANCVLQNVVTSTVQKDFYDDGVGVIAGFPPDAESEMDAVYIFSVPTDNCDIFADGSVIIPSSGLWAVPNAFTLTIPGYTGFGGGNTRTITGIETDTVTFSATDSRGYSSSVNVTKSFVPYIKLTNNSTAVRPDPTSGKVTLKIEGSCFNGNFGLKDNAVTAKYYIDGGNPVDAIVTMSGNAYSVTLNLTGFNYQSSYSIEVVVTDKLMTVSRTLPIQKGIPVFDWGEDDFRFNVPTCIGDDVRIWTDGEGGNVEIKAGNGHTNKWQIDAFDGNLRFYTYRESDGSIQGITFDQENGSIRSDSVLGAYPVGAIYMSFDPTSPAALFGGTWERLHDAFLWGTKTDSNIGKTGGETAHTLTINEMPSHTHDIQVLTGWAETTWLDPWVPYIRNADGSHVTDTGTSGASGKFHPWEIPRWTGGSRAHNNMPPYLEVAMWKRVG